MGRLSCFEGVLSFPFDSRRFSSYPGMVLLWSMLFVCEVLAGSKTCQLGRALWNIWNSDGILIWVVVSNIFYFHPYSWGFMIQFDYIIFFKWVGCLNHQVVIGFHWFPFPFRFDLPRNSCPWKGLPTEAFTPYRHGPSRETWRWWLEAGSPWTLKTIFGVSGCF